MASLEEYMLPCLNKKIFGIDCLGCGMQRSLIMIFRGEFAAAFSLYPAIYTIILMLAILALHLKFKFKYGAKIILALFVINMSIIIINYISKFI